MDGQLSLRGGGTAGNTPWMCQKNKKVSWELNSGKMKLEA